MKRMDHSIYFFSLIFLITILQSFECRDLETKTPSTTSFDTPNLNIKTHNSRNLTKSDNLTNGIIYDISKNDSNSVTITNRYSLKNDKFSTTESSVIDGSRFTDSKLQSTTESTEINTNTGENLKMSIILQESFHNSVLEPWNRIRRNNEDGGSSEPANSDNYQQDNASDSNPEEIKDDSYQDNDAGAAEGEDEDEDLTNASQNEESSSQLDPAETGSTDVEEREKRNTGSSEVLEVFEGRSRLNPSWYPGPSFGNRYWSSYERESPQNFIRIPVFPGK